MDIKIKKIIVFKGYLSLQSFFYNGNIIIKKYIIANSMSVIIVEILDK